MRIDNLQYAKWSEKVFRQMREGAVDAVHVTIAYHENRPQAQHAGDSKHGFAGPKVAPARNLAKRHFNTQDLQPLVGPAIDGLMPMLFNDDVVASVLHPSEPDPVYFVNGDGDDDVFAAVWDNGTEATLSAFAERA